MELNIDSSWKNVLADLFVKDAFLKLKSFLCQEKELGKIIYPSEPKIFKAFNLTPFPDVKVVILGQDPYHQRGQAMGLSFSVPDGTKIPPSLRNIYKELSRDIKFNIPSHGNLEPWSGQGVLLLNAILTVESGKAGSHRKKGWESFTDGVIQKLSAEREHLVFMLWGNYAKSKKSLIDTHRHLVLEAFHPSPLAGNRFVGCAHFSQANHFLLKNNKKTIDWSLNQET